MAFSVISQISKWKLEIVKIVSSVCRISLLVRIIKEKGKLNKINIKILTEKFILQRQF